MPPNLPLIRLSSVNPFLLELSRRNLDGGVILRKMGLPAQVPASGDLFASALAVYEIVEECAQIADDRYLGHRIGQEMDPVQWEPIAQAIADASTVGDLLGHFVVNTLAHTSSTQFFVRTEGERSTFGFTRIVVPTFQPGQNDAFYLGLITNLLKQAVAQKWDATKLLATVSDPDAIPSSGQGIRLAQGDHTGIRMSFPTAWQFAPLAKRAFGITVQSSREGEVPKSLLDSVHQALIPHLSESKLTVDRAAEICGYDKRQLSRNLRIQGTTIVKELAALRAASAREKIAGTKMRIADIGSTVGFRDPTVFSRAFKNWTGQSPQEFRRNNKH